MSAFMLGKGMKVTNMDGIHECYTIKKVDTAYTFQANISIQNINKLIEAFYERLVEPCFLILEVPTNIANEEILRKVTAILFTMMFINWTVLVLIHLKILSKNTVIYLFIYLFIY